MADNKGKYKEIANALVLLSKTNQETIAQLNKSAMKYLSSETLHCSFCKLINKYNDFIKCTGYWKTANDSLTKAFAAIQINSLRQLSQSYKTNMIKSLSECFLSANYAGITKIINQTVSNSIIPAVDIAFLKTSDLINVFYDELDYPRGLYSSIRALNKATALSVAENDVLKYSTTSNTFTSEGGEIDSRGLNVVCSGRIVLNDSGDQLFTDNELIDFCSFLSDTPMFALMNVTGKKIKRLLETLYSKRTNTIGFDEDAFYHSRTRAKNEMGYTCAQMMKAPYGVPSAGRFNHPGQSHYYFSNTKEGAEAEVKRHLKRDDVLQTIKIVPTKEATILDLSGSLARGKTFLRYLRYKLSDESEKAPKEYLIPCFVADCCKTIGFDGIKYYGSKEHNNYVVWDDGYFKYGGVC